MPTMTERGINALRQGRRAEARALLRQSIAQNPDDVRAWLWLSGAVDSVEERLRCLLKVLEIDPDNTLAAKGLAKLVLSGQVYIQPLRPTEQAKRRLQERPWAEAERELFHIRPSIISFIVAVIVVSAWASLSLWVSVKLFDDEVMKSLFGFFILLAAVALYWRIGIALLRALFARYTLTTKYLKVKTGILSHRQKTIPIHKIQDVSVQQPFMLRPFGIGHVIVESAGGQGEIKLRALSDCQKRSQQILWAVEKFG